MEVLDLEWKSEAQWLCRVQEDGAMCVAEMVARRVRRIRLCCLLR